MRPACTGTSPARTVKYFFLPFVNSWARVMPFCWQKSSNLLALSSPPSSFRAVLWGVGRVWETVVTRGHIRSLCMKAR